MLPVTEKKDYNTNFHSTAKVLLKYLPCHFPGGCNAWWVGTGWSAHTNKRPVENIQNFFSRHIKEFQGQNWRFPGFSLQASLIDLASPQCQSVSLLKLWGVLQLPDPPTVTVVALHFIGRCYSCFLLVDNHHLLKCMVLHNTHLNWADGQVI